MSDVKIDVRIQKTKSKLKHSMLCIMEKKTIDAITVTELCLDAAVNRNTFYTHYADPHALLEEVETEVLSEVIGPLQSANLQQMSIVEFLQAILQAIKDNREACQVILGNNGDAQFLMNVINIPKGVVIENWEKGKNLSPSEAQLWYTYIVWGAISVIREWVTGGCKEEVSLLSEALSRIIMHGEES